MSSQPGDRHLMRILFLTPRFPYPPHKGDQVLAYHRIRTLSSRHEIVLLTFFERESELEGLQHLERFCKKIHTVRLSRWRSYWNMMHLGFSRTPLQILYYRSNQYRSKLREILSRQVFDVVHGFMLRLAPYLTEVEAPRVLELIDSMQLNMGRMSDCSSGLRRLLYAEEHRRIRSYESLADQFAERLVFVSETDRAMVPSDRSVVVPLGVIAPKAVKYPPPGRVVVFSGNMSYAPNVDAATWFARHAWDSVRRKVPDAEFWVVGSNPHPRIQQLSAQPGIRVTGSVPEMAAVLRQAHVAVAPMRSGSGMQSKVLEAMACGLPVVTTRLGLGAIEARPGEELLVADEPAEFAAAVATLLIDPQRREAMGSKAHSYVSAKHSWEHMADRIEVLYQAITGQPGEPATRQIA